MKLKAGDWVRVRSKEEILATLDKNGRMDNLPFQPQMFQYCGQKLQVYKRAHKTCDTISGTHFSRALPDGIHLDLRCDGAVYGGCQAACLLYWKAAWLEPVDADGVPDAREPAPVARAASQGCTEADVLRATSIQKDGEVRYVCQATTCLEFTAPLKWWNARQYVEDYTSGNVTLGRIVRGFTYVALYCGTLAHRYRLGRPARWLHGKLRVLWGGRPLPRALGTIPQGQANMVSDLNLQAGELVRVKSHEEILTTLDQYNHNRGMSFDAEMTPYCGRVLRVRNRVEQFVDEKNGKLRRLKTPAVILEGGICEGCYSDYRMFCPRAIYAWWREIWLERVTE